MNTLNKNIINIPRVLCQVARLLVVECVCDDYKRCLTDIQRVLQDLPEEYRFTTQFDCLENLAEFAEWVVKMYVDNIENEAEFLVTVQAQQVIH